MSTQTTHQASGAATVIGASGLVGGWLYRCAQAQGQEISGTYLQNAQPGLFPLDVRQADAVHEWMAHKLPQVIYLPAALANVDYCELNPATSYDINVIGMRNVVVAANHVRAKVVFFSSDYIFDGQAGPYREDDPSNPICQYGREKLLAEHYVALHALDYLIVRTTVVYGTEAAGKNFIYRLIRSLRSGQAISVPVDQIGSPTYAPDLARAVLELVRCGARGVFHVVGPRCTSRYEFACKAARVFGMDESLIKPVTTEELAQPAKRPLKAGMLADKALALLSAPLRDHAEALVHLADDPEFRGSQRMQRLS